MQALRVFGDFGLMAAEPVLFQGQQINPKEFLRAHVLQHAADVCGDGEWAFLLNVQVTGERDGAPATRELRTSHPPRAQWGTSATAKVTGIPASIGAQKLAR